MNGGPARRPPPGRTALLLVCLLAAGCVTPPGPPDPRDPLEGFNRSVYAFNDRLDDYVLTPTARGYQAVTPEFVDTGVTNFFANLDDIGIALNNLLQFKFKRAVSDVGRLCVNTTVGILGFFDVATRLGLEKHNEDFGQTLGYWGVPRGPYLVLPLFGPSSFRDGPSRIVDGYMNLLTYYPDEWKIVWSLYALDAVDTRADLFAVEKRFEDVMFDPYATLRNVYLERRAFLVHDGRPPPQDDLLKELEELESGSDESGADESGARGDPLFLELEKIEAEEKEQ